MSVKTRDRFLLAAASIFACVSFPLAQSAGSDEEVARRQLESGRSFIRQGNFTEALKDFRAVADTHGTSSVADNALLEIARYYLDTAGDAKSLGRHPAILKTY
jgi:Flp pilus assembly protein TadD